MTRLTAFSSPLLLGFDEMERLLERAAKTQSDGYPPYNIERVAAAGNHPELIRITLALAGFTRDDLDITLEERQLVIRGRQTEDTSQRVFLHRGIAARHFQRAFVVAEGIEVSSARLANGLLEIDLVRPEPARVTRRIDIMTKER